MNVHIFLCICICFIPSSSWCNIPWQWLYKQSTDRYTSLINVRSCTEALPQSENWETKFEGGSIFQFFLTCLSFSLNYFEMCCYRCDFLCEGSMQNISFNSLDYRVQNPVQEASLTVLKQIWQSICQLDEKTVTFLTVLLGHFNWSIHGSSCSTKFTRACSQADDIPLSACNRLTSQH